MIQKRALAVLAISAFAGAALPLGLPQVAKAAAFDSISFMPFPIAQAGTLAAGATVDICVQPRIGTAPAGAGVTVYLSIDSGLFTSPPATGGSAVAGASATSLTTTPTAFVTSGTPCTSQGGISSDDSVSVVYTAPSPVPPHGRDVIIAADNAADSGSGGVCPGAAGSLCNNDTYVYSPVTQYAISLAPTIAMTGTLAASASVPFTVTAEDSAGHAVPGAFIDLSLTSTSTGGTATAVNNFSLSGGPPRTESLNSEPTRFGSDAGGVVSVTYKTPGTLPSSAVVDTITAQDHTLTPTAQGSTTYTYSGTAPPPPTSNPYTAITPSRVCDTRPAAPPGIEPNQCNTGPGSGPITQGATRIVTVVGGSVPAGITAVVVNVTAIGPTQGTFLTLFPDLVSRPQTVSNLNPAAGSVVANLVEVGVSAAGKIDVFNANGTVNIAIDVEGYVSSTSPGKLNSITPVRVCDTRGVAPGIGTNQCNHGSTSPSPIAGNGTMTFAVNNGSIVPTSGVSAVVLNLTAISPTSGTVLTAFAGGTSRPTASNLNLNAHKTLPNRVIVPVTCGGGNCTVSIWNSVGSVNVAIDVDGWYATGSGSQFTAITPSRVCDTRYGTGGAAGCFEGTVAHGGVLNLYVPGLDGIPPLTNVPPPVAIVANVTAVNATTGTFVTVYPGPSTATPPTASDLNVSPGGVDTNLVIVELGSDGTFNLFNDLGNVDLIVDVFGYYS